LAIRLRILPPDHPQIAETYNNVAYTLDVLGKFTQALPIHERALGIYLKVFGEYHPLTAASYNNIAYNLNAQGKTQKAQPLFEKSLNIRRRVYTDEHPETTAGFNNLAGNLMAQGKFAEAQPLLEKALEINRRLLSDDNPQTALSYANLAASLKAQGKPVQALPLFEKALEINVRLLTDDHPNTALSYNNLATDLGDQGRYADAHPLYEKALSIRRKVLSDNHPYTAQSYIHVASSLGHQGKYAEAQQLLEKALEIDRRILSDDHPGTADCYDNLAYNLNAQGKYELAQPVFEKALSIRQRLFTDDHPDIVGAYCNVAGNLYAMGKYSEARDRWLIAVKSLDQARTRVAFTGLGRSGTGMNVRPTLAAVLARLGQPAEAWQTLEQDFGRGLLDELAAQHDRRLTPSEREHLLELTAALERLERLVETTPRNLNQTERAKRFEDLKHQRERASIALGEFQAKLARDHGAASGQVAELSEIQAVLPADAALVAWVDIAPRAPNEADPDGDHWGVVVRSKGAPAWVSIAGTGKESEWTIDDGQLARRVRTELRKRPEAAAAELRTRLKQLRSQRIEPLAKALGASIDGLPPARRLIFLPTHAMRGIPIEPILADDDTRIASYAPSASVFKYLRERPRPDSHAGLLALGDPVYEHPDTSSEPKPLPDHGLLVNTVVPGSNAATHGLKPGDVLLAYNGIALNKKDDLKVVVEGDKAIGVNVWRNGKSSTKNLAPGKLGVILDSRPARAAIAANRAMDQALVASRGGEVFEPLPGTRYEVEALAQLFKADDRPVRTLLGPDASEPELDHLAASGELKHFGFLHLATHDVIDQDFPARSAVILTQTGLPDPLEQVLHHKPAFDGRLLVREIQRGWELSAELVTLSACETALGRDQGGEGLVGFTQALLISGTRSVCLSLWRVDDTATALLMQRFYANMLGRRPGLTSPIPKAEALREAKLWLRTLKRSEALALTADMSGGVERSKGTKARTPAELSAAIPAGADADRPYASPHFWAAFVLVGDPD
jgi:CHAT domain-containing protein/Tfp pilus assembly protein PilF